jgi:hypothetical protein
VLQGMETGTRGFRAPTDAGNGDRKPGQYSALVQRIKEVALAAIPTGAVVAVVSRGDDDLLFLGGSVGWHFPQTPSGTYAGFNPETSDDAIRELEAVRERGARYLLLPATAFWWLDHYQGFRLHLERLYPLVLREEGACAIYALSPRQLPKEQTSARVESELQGLARQINELAGALLPRGATVAVVSRGDEALLHLEGCREWHIPQMAHGAYAGHDPGNSAEAVAQLKEVTRRGAGYLLVPAPAFWWLDAFTGFRRYLDQRSRLVVRQRHVCAIYELDPTEARWTPDMPFPPWKKRRG